MSLASLPTTAVWHRTVAVAAGIPARSSCSPTLFRRRRFLAAWGPQHMPIAGLRRRVNDASMRIIYVAAAVFMAPVVLMGASPAHADTHSYLRCIKSDAELPPGAEAKNLPYVSFIETEINSGKSHAHVAQELMSMGVKPDVAVLQVNCVMENWPIGTS